MNIKHNRDEVLKKGFKLFKKQGYTSLGVAKICELTGMTKGSFYNAFESKENFMIECIKSYGEMNTSFLFNELNKDKSRSIDRLLDMYVGMLSSQEKSGFSGCLLNNAMNEISATNEKICELTEVSFKNLLIIIEPVIIEAQKQGDINAIYNSKSVTELIHTAFFGVLTRLKSSKDMEQAINTMKLLINSLKN